MRVLHILDHSIPLHSGYTFRTRSILREQQALGWDTFHVTGSKQGVCADLEEDVDGLHFYRTPVIKGPLAKLPVLNQKAVIDGLTRRLSEIIPLIKPDVLHAHSPCLNAIAALRPRPSAADSYPRHAARKIWSCRPSQFHSVARHHIDHSD